LAWSGQGPVGRIIRAWTGQTYSHVGIAWVVGGRVLVLEAKEGRGVAARPLSKALPVFWVSTGSQWTANAETFALEHLGEPYSYLDALRGGLGLATGRKNGWQCAEYAAAVLNRALFPTEPLGFYPKQPGTLVNLALQTGGVGRMLT